MNDKLALDGTGLCKWNHLVSFVSRGSSNLALVARGEFSQVTVVVALPIG